MKPNANYILMGILLLALAVPFWDINGLDWIDRTARDFPSFYYGPEYTFEYSSPPYSQVRWAEAQVIFGNDALFPYLYPPPSLVFFRSLNFLPYESAKVLFLVVNHLLALLILYLVVRRVIRLAWDSLLTALIIVYTLSFWPLIATIQVGQVNLIVLTLLLLVWLGLRQEWHPAVAGSALALAILIKFSPLIFLVYLALSRRWRPLAWCVAVLGALSIATLPFLPAGIWSEWVREVLVGGYGVFLRGQDPASVSIQGVNGFVSRLFLGREDRIAPIYYSPGIARLGAYFLAAVIAGIPAFRIWRQRGLLATDWGFSTFLLVMYLTTPLAWDHHLVFVLPVILLAIRSAQQTEDFGWLVGLGAVAILLAFNFPYNLPILRSGIGPLLISAKFFGLLALWVFMVRRRMITVE